MSASRLSVACFTNTRVRAGVEEHILTLLRGFDRNRVRPFLICPEVLLAELAADIPADVGVLSLDLSNPAQLGAAVRLARFLRSNRIDLLHCHMFQSSLAAAPVAWLCGVPAIVETAHGREDWRRGWIKSRFFIDRMAGRFVDRFIAVSEGCAGYLKDNKGLPARKIQVIPNGCDTLRFSDAPAATELRGKLGLHNDDLILVVVGRLEPQKGHRVLLDAMPAILALAPKARLVCVGDGSLRPELEAQAARLGIADAVRFVGYQPRAEDWLALADVVVLPSFYEGMPLVALEALSSGRAMVATKVDGTSEVIEDGKSGIIVPSGDAAALAAAIVRLLRDPALRDALGKAGRRRVVERFSQQKQLERTQELYLGLMAQKKTGKVKIVHEDKSERAIV